MGNAMEMTQYISLTPNMQSKQDALWNQVPCFLRDWELQVHFKTHEQGRRSYLGVAWQFGTQRIECSQGLCLETWTHLWGWEYL
jgi:hypothetical protein